VSKVLTQQHVAAADLHHDQVVAAQHHHLPSVCVPRRPISGYFHNPAPGCGQTDLRPAGFARRPRVSGPRPSMTVKHARTLT
jgi:hypothetical protein